MSTKPTIANARWADLAGAGKSAPSSGERDSGFVTGAPIVAAVFDYLLNQFYEWAKHVNEAAQLQGDSTNGYRLGEKWISAVDGYLTDGGTNVRVMDRSGAVSSTTESRVLLVDLGVHAGDRIRSITIYGREGNLAGETYSAKIWRETTSSEAQISTTKTSGVTNAFTSIGWTTADTDLTPNGYTVATGGALMLEIIIAQTSAAAEVRIQTIKVECDRPA